MLVSLTFSWLSINRKSTPLKFSKVRKLCLEKDNKMPSYMPVTFPLQQPNPNCGLSPKQFRLA